MEIDKAFTYMFEDETWPVKFLIGVLLTLLGVFVFVGVSVASFFLSFFSAILTRVPLGSLLSLVGTVGLIFTMGYVVLLIRNVAQGELRPLPDWSRFGEIARKGFVIFIVGLIYQLPIVLLTLCASATALVLPTSNTSDPNLAALATAVQLAFSCLNLLYALFLAIILPAILIRYAVTDRFASCFQFVQLFGFITANLGNYFVAILMALVAALIGMLGLIVCGIGIAVTGFYAALVIGHLYGQVYRQAQLRGTGFQTI